MTKTTIDSFSGEYRFLSNFWPCQIVVEEDGWFPCYTLSTEHAYQGLKTIEPSERMDIFSAPTAGQAKRLGKKVTLRPEWCNEQFRIKVMRGLIQQKFTKHPVLADKLLQTGNLELVEGNTWGDTFWGVCDGIGTNWLGKILMDVRLTLAQEENGRYHS